MKALVVSRERTPADRRAFIDVPYRLYRSDPVWVPTLRSEEAKLMDRTKNPFFEHAEVEHFLARRGDRVVGRIAAIENRRHNEFHEDRVGFFGFFDVEPDQEAATALIAAAKAWNDERGLAPMRGPVNYSTNESCGVLIENFEEPPRLLMPYNRPDYATLLEGAGLVKAKDLLAIWAPTHPTGPERFRRVVQRQLKRRNITLRPFDLHKNYAHEVEVFRDLYNRCWERNWGFVPASDAEFTHAAKDLKKLIEPNMSAIAERDGVPVGFSVFLRDLNLLLAKGPRSGRMTPWFAMKLLCGIKKIKTTRCILLGVVPEARGMAINEAFFLHGSTQGHAAGHKGTEAGWLLEDNPGILHPLYANDGKIAKRYRIYETP